MILDQTRRVTTEDLFPTNIPPNFLRSIVIVNYNGGSKLLECVKSIFEFTSDFEIIIVDNASSDGSLSPIEERYPRAMILRSPENLGVARANNIAIKRAKGSWIILLNPDTKVTKNWLEALLDCGNLSNDIGIVTPKLLYMDSKRINSTGHIFYFKTAFARDRGAGEIDHGQYDATKEIASCCFACAAIRKEVVNKIGLLDEKMFMYFEDVDYCVRARVAGWRLLYCPKSTVLHVGAGVTPGRKLTRLLKNATPYRLRIMLKSYRLSNAVKYGAMSILVSIAAGIKNRDLGYVMPYLRSPIWNLQNLPLDERRFVQSTRRISDSALAQRQLIDPR